MREQSATPTAQSVELDPQPIRIRIASYVAEEVVPGSVKFTFAGKTYIDRLGRLIYDPTDGAALDAGSIDYSTGQLEITWWQGGVAPTFELLACITQFGMAPVTGAVIRTLSAPLKPEAFQLTAVTADGELIIRCWSLVSQLPG
ncbi:MAG: hypothetical protein MZV65_28690 [Chromatiales bacterium]|nr:hypothetical protein [Chromatiales bacterium]